MTLQFFDLTNHWGHGMPEWPSGPGIRVNQIKTHALHGERVAEWEGIMHRGTHMDAPVHVTEEWPDITEYPLWHLYGTGVAVSIPKERWGVVSAADLEAATPRIEPGDIVMINTGAHRLFGDNDDYYAYSPGIYLEAAEWLVERGVRLVGMDTNALDHPLGTKLVEHGIGPSHPHLVDEYIAETGRNPLEDFPLWEPAHKTMMGNGIAGIENVGGQLDEVTGKRCTFLAFPWRWTGGDGSGVRVVAILDPDGDFRYERG